MIRRGCCSIVQQVMEWAAHRITTAILNTVIADIAVLNSSVRSPSFEQKFDFVQFNTSNNREACASLFIEDVELNESDITI